MERMGAFAGIAFAESDMLIVPQSSQRSASSPGHTAGSRP